MNASPPSAEPLVSVVTPVHDTADHLAACIESVLRQTHGRFEYLVVDNRSTDGSLAIAERYAAGDPRIRVLRTDELLPQRENYNFALSRISAQSRYCKVVQADDWIFPDCLEEMVALGEADPGIAIVGAYQLSGRHVKCQGLECGGDAARPWTIVSGREACRRYLLERTYLFGTPTSLLYRADLVRERHPFFPRFRLHWDAALCFDLLKRARFGFVHRLLTFTREEPGSVSDRIRSYRPDSLLAHMITVAYGPAYLDDDELTRLGRATRREIHANMGASIPWRRDRGFWEHHRRQLAEVGERISWGRIAGYQLRRAAGWIGNPLATAGKVTARLGEHRTDGDPEGPRC